MKRTLVTVILLITVLLATACSKVEPANLPLHLILQKSATIPENASGLCGAYILAVDTAINLCTDNKLKQKPEFISFNFTSTFPLHQEEKDLMVKQFEVYGIPVDTRGFNPPERTMEEMLKGYIIEFPSSAQYTDPKADLTITVTINNGRMGYIYNFDFVVKKGKYILINYDDDYLNVRL